MTECKNPAPENEGAVSEQIEVIKKKVAALEAEIQAQHKVELPIEEISKAVIDCINQATASGNPVLLI